MARDTRPPMLLARFLLPIEATPDSSPSSAWARSARWLPLWGLAIGILYAAAYRGAWKWFGEYQRLRLVPAVILLAVDFGFFGYRQIAAAVRLADDKAGTSPANGIGLPGALAVLLIGLFKLTVLVVLPAGARIWPADWRQYLGALYPGVVYRPLVLMPLWGRWAMMLGLSIGRVSPEGSERLRLMAGGTRLAEIIGCWALITLLTVAFTSAAAPYLAHGVAISVAVLLTAYLVNFGLARRCGGQSEATVAATSLAAELAFLIFYLPLASSIYWY